MTKSGDILSDDKERLEKALKFIMRKEGIRKKDIAESIDMDPRTLSAQTTHATKKVQLYVVERLEQVYNYISKEWILLGSGKMLKNLSVKEPRIYDEHEAINPIILENEIEYLRRENKILREMNEILKKQHDNNSK